MTRKMNPKKAASRATRPAPRTPTNHRETEADTAAKEIQEANRHWPKALRRLRRRMLRFTPTAWAKLHYFCHRGGTEIGGFGITEPDDPLRIVDFVTVRQQVTAVSVSFDDEAVADFFEAQVDAGRQPMQFARIWLHTHPGDCPEPSGTDEETFARVFGRCDWAVMFILAKQGKTYARLRFNVGPGGQVLVPVAVDYDEPFGASDHETWEAEYEANIQLEHCAQAQAGMFGPTDPELLAGELDPTSEQEALQMLAAAEADDFEDFYEEEMEL